MSNKKKKNEHHTSTIIDFSQLDFKRLKLKSPRSFNSHLTTYEIEYKTILNSRQTTKKKSIPLIIQTPKMYLPFGLSKSYQQDDKYNLQMTFQDFTKIPNSKMENFKNKIDQLDQYFSDKYPDKLFHSSIKSSDDNFYPPYIRTKLPNQTNLQVYDCDKNSQKLDYIVPGCWGTSLIYLKNLWISSSEQNEIMGLSWYVLQIKVITPVPVLSKFLIDDDSYDEETLCAICHKNIVKKQCVQGVDQEDQEDEKNSVKLPEEYNKYTKMLKLGIPILAVIQRCQMDGLDPEVLSKQHPSLKSETGNNLKLQSLIPLKREPLVQQITRKEDGPPRLVVTKEDLINLRKNLSTPRNVKPPLRIPKVDPRVPSLNMLLSRLKNLRSTKK